MTDIAGVVIGALNGFVGLSPARDWLKKLFPGAWPAEKKGGDVEAGGESAVSLHGLQTVINGSDIKALVGSFGVFATASKTQAEAVDKFVQHLIDTQDRAIDKPERLDKQAPSKEENLRLSSLDITLKDIAALRDRLLAVVKTFEDGRNSTGDGAVRQHEENPSSQSDLEKAKGHGEEGLASANQKTCVLPEEKGDKQTKGHEGEDLASANQKTCVSSEEKGDKQKSLETAPGGDTLKVVASGHKPFEEVEMGKAQNFED
ncbi:hypothetical protein FQN54_008187 [Arachnomyces sp. PD_36]|nr:hypothetical protein FQN54_008187 [Arachnomyces sp. PD_36]